jgi:hypothetical protein
MGNTKPLSDARLIISYMHIHFWSVQMPDQTKEIKDKPLRDVDRLSHYPLVPGCWSVL